MARLKSAVAGVPFRVMEWASRRKGKRKPVKAKSVYAFTPADIAGKPAPLERYRGQVLLIVNTASECGFTPQYESLQALHERYAGRGLRVLGFPCNDFGAQEPGEEPEIAKFCKASFGVSFDLFAKVAVKGPQADPLFAYLTQESPCSGAIVWNFTKFLADRKGEIVTRFGPADDPLSEAVTGAIEKALAHA